jgi:ATP-dependent Lhr-like helicase
MTEEVPAALEFLALPPTPETALAALADPVRRWFVGHLGTPTAAQRLAWPALVAGKHLLLCAPTGGGKTLAAFLPVLGELLAGALSPGVRCLYVAPLKALGNDARKALRRHLHGIRAFLPSGHGDLRIALRTGDTSAAARREFRQRPPEILLTTPESLAVLLSRGDAAELFANLRWVVVDEVHALAANKRGADLALSLERLQALCGERRLQRIGLSATCTPLDEAARFLAGGRPCTVAQVADHSPLHLTVEPLPGPAFDGSRLGRSFLGDLVSRLGPELTEHHGTLIFTNSRNLAERLAWALRQRFPAWDQEIAVHHSALAAVRRRRVEHRFKRGRLRAVVSSTSLELGIDIGSVALVVLVHPPGGVVRLLQRVGRAGHEPGGVRRGLVLTAGAAELLESAVTAASARSVAGSALPAQCEPLRVVSRPLDVLCQQLLGMAAQRSWSVEEAWALVRRAYPYADLPRADFDACLDYLSGRHADGRSWLPARLRWHPDSFEIDGERTARLLRQNVGSILDDEARPVVLETASGREGEAPAEPAAPARDGAGSAGASPSRLPVGEVDEGFAERLQPGDRFLLDGRCLEFRRSEGQTLLVQEVPGRPAVPRWSGEGLPLSPDLARRLYLLRVQAAEALRHGPDALTRLLRHDYGLGGEALEDLAGYFRRQESVSEIPDTGCCLIEAVRNHSAGGADYYLHTPLNRAGNDALARVLVLRLGRRGGAGLASLVADLGLGLFVRQVGRQPPPPDLAPEDWRALLSAEGFAADLEAALADSEALRGRFRRAATVGLMLLRNPAGQRRRVGGRWWWGESRLFDQVRAADPDFVLLRQARREVCLDCCDAATAAWHLEDLPRRLLRLRWLAAPSPFAEGWTQMAAGPFETAESPEEALRRLHAALTGGGRA